MKKLLVILAMAFTTFVVKGENTNSLYFGNELGVSVLSGYNLDNDYNANLDIGLNYFATRNFGVEVSTPAYRTDSTIFDTVDFGVLARYPIATLAPYVGAGASHNFDLNLWNYRVKAGLEFRFNEKWALFGAGTYTLDDLNKSKEGSFGVQGGIKLIF